MGAARDESVPTPPQGIEAEVVRAATLDDVATLGDEARGRIVFLASPMADSSSFANYGKAVGARVMGAIAVVVRSIGTDDNRLPHTGYVKTPKATDGARAIPVAAISPPDADMLEAAANTQSSIKRSSTTPSPHSKPMQVTASQSAFDACVRGRRVDHRGRNHRLRASAIRSTRARAVNDCRSASRNGVALRIARSCGRTSSKSLENGLGNVAARRLLKLGPMLRSAFVLGVVGLLFSPSVADARDCAYYGVPHPSFYGGQTGFNQTYVDHMNTLGAATARLGFRLDGHASWDASLLAEYDSTVKFARTNGIELIGLVHAESSYVNSSSTDPNGWNYDPGTNWNNYVQQFMGIVFTLMDRYGPYIKIWEIWNEENSVVYITAPIYARLMAEIYNQGHDIINRWGLHVSTGGMYSENSYDASGYINALYGQTGRWDWLQQHYGRRYPWDYFGYHIYLDRGGATTVSAQSARVTDVHNMEAAYGDSSPLLITEFGWTTDPNNVEHQLWVSEQTQADNIGDALTAYESHPEVARALVFREDEWAGYGVYHGDWTPKPAVSIFASHTKGCTHAPLRPVVPTSCTDANGKPGVCTITMLVNEQRNFVMRFYNDGLPPWPAQAKLATTTSAVSPLANGSWETPQVVAHVTAPIEGGLTADFPVPLQFAQPGTYEDQFVVTVSDSAVSVPATLRVIVTTTPVDAGTPADAGEPPVDPGPGGCGCRTSPVSNGGSWWTLLALGLAFARRRNIK